jgi:hypothetical protein
MIGAASTTDAMIGPPWAMAAVELNAPAAPVDNSPLT